MAVEFSPDTLRKFHEIRGRYPTARAALLPTLHLAQKEFGWISEDAMRYVAGLLGLEPIKVLEVVTFYTMFLRKPPGKYHLQVCTNISCSLVGGARLYRHLARKLGISSGETTPDGRFTLTEVECLASCGTAPAMQINGRYFENLTPERVDRLLAELP
jgi:NADH-quinone oxidoreductase subunit E